jgi:hypothetical protein
VYEFEIPPTVRIEDDVFGPGTDWRTMTECDDYLGGTAFAVLSAQSLRAADALRSVKETFGLVGEDGLVYPEDDEDRFEVYTPNYVHDVMHLPGVGASIGVDTKGVLIPDMARTMLRLIVHALAVRDVSATLVHYDRADWTAAVTYVTSADELQNDLMRRLSAQHQEIERGIARGMSWAVLGVLGERGITVPEAVRDQIFACTDLARFDRWIRRAVTATTAEDVTRCE